MGKGLAQALACLGTMNAAELEIAVRTAFEKYLQFDGTVHKKAGSSCTLTTSGRRFSQSSCRRRSSARTI
ncbi:MAG: hypothetical protein ACLRSD_12510 [Oscillibacter sp.]